MSIVYGFKRLGKGDFTARLTTRFNDERDLIVKTFNQIVPKIEEHMRMSKALGLAKEVQQSLLPQKDPSLSGFDIAGASIYCDETGGDYYDFIETNRGGHAGLAVMVGPVYAPYLSGDKTYAASDTAFADPEERPWRRVQYLGTPRRQGRSSGSAKAESLAA